jgi:hypothetical protein
MITVYIASPYTQGDVAMNVRKQIIVADELMELDIDICPVVPLFTHFQHMIRPRHYEDWMKIDLEKVKRSDILLRLSGESPGADREVKYAEGQGIPVVYSVEELKELVINGVEELI